MTFDFDIPFVTASFFLLGIERLFYGYWYIYPNSFKTRVRKGTFGNSIKQEPLFWKSAMTLGKYIKVFQFSVVIYDLLIRCDLANTFIPEFDAIKFAVGWLFIIIGQGLNIAVFKALGGIGVYYGYEFGYDVRMVKTFPYNVPLLSDPQYWGVVVTIWGVYIALNKNNSSIIPLYETFWYIMSMKFFEHPRGRKIVQKIFGPDVAFVKVV